MLLAASESSRAVETIGEAAAHALRLELAVAPKPGLVTLVSSGSHTDMDAATFLASIAAITPYFHEIAAAGFALSSFAVLQRLGIEAERTMSTATSGINTHRGAIFTLGLLAAAAGRMLRCGRPLAPASLTAFVAACWGPDILDAADKAPRSPGSLAAQAHGVPGARQQAARGFPAISRLALPAFRRAHRRTRCLNAAAVETLFALIADLDDTNLLHRGGREGADFARDAAAGFLTAGGVSAPGWETRAEAIGEAFVARRLSPGGCADLLAATLFLVEIERAEAVGGSRSSVSWAG